MKIVPVLAASLLFGVVACSSSDTPAQGGGLDSDGNDPSGVAGSAPDTNPEGYPYPIDNVGTQARKGSGETAKHGSRIANYKFLGYPDANVSAGLQPISLAQFFDPTGAKYRIIHIQAAGVWCGVCQTETTAVVPLKDQLEAKKAVWLVSLAEGPTGGVPSTRKDLDGWIKKFSSPFTHWLDPGNENLGPFYDASALPWNANIDARTMEILSAGTGGTLTQEGLIAEIDEALHIADTTIADPLPAVEQPQ